MRGRRFGRPGLLGTMARTAVIAGTANAVVGGMNRAQAQQTPPQAYQQPVYQQQPAPPVYEAAAAPLASTPADDLTSQIERLAALRSSGVLTGDEFLAAKAKLLGI